MTVENLEQVKAELYKLFNEAVERHPDYEDCEDSGSSTPFNPTIQNRIALSELGRSIATVEKELREEKEFGTSRLPNKL